MLPPCSEGLRTAGVVSSLFVLLLWKPRVMPMILTSIELLNQQTCTKLGDGTRGIRHWPGGPCRRTRRHGILIQTDTQWRLYAKATA